MRKYLLIIGLLVIGSIGIVFGQGIIEQGTEKHITWDTFYILSAFLGVCMSGALIFLWILGKILARQSTLTESILLKLGVTKAGLTFGIDANKQGMIETINTTAINELEKKLALIENSQGGSVTDFLNLEKNILSVVAEKEIQLKEQILAVVTERMLQLKEQILAISTEKISQLKEQMLDAVTEKVSQLKEQILTTFTEKTTQIEERVLNTIKREVEEFKQDLKEISVIKDVLFDDMQKMKAIIGIPTLARRKNWGVHIIIGILSLIGLGISTLLLCLFGVIK